VSIDISAQWKARHKRWLRFVQGTIKAMEAGRKIPIGPSPKRLVAPARPVRGGQTLKVMFCAPHPDDECLLGALPLRLRLDAGARVTNCAITLGSNLEERPRRLRELESACLALGFALIVPNRPLGFDRVNLDNRNNKPEEWQAKVEVLRKIFEQEKPDVVMAPHAEDFNTTHIGTHYLVVDALGAYLEQSGQGLFPFIETEYWHENPRPNLMLGLSPEVVAIQLMATAEHGGEVKRNPYHLRQPGRLMDKVRLGSEVVGGQGGRAFPFPFAELYRVTFLKGREKVDPKPGGRIVKPKERIDFAAIVKQFMPEGG
jgi:LmbE family N-acetylglucosaminyl deacetylase